MANNTQEVAMDIDIPEVKVGTGILRILQRRKKCMFVGCEEEAMDRICPNCPPPNFCRTHQQLVYKM